MVAGAERFELREAMPPGQRLTIAMLLLPIAVLLVIFFLIPFLFEIGYSVQRYDPAQGYLPGFTLKNYEQLFTDDYYLTIWWRTVRIAVIVTAICTVMAYPVAMVLARARGWLKTALLLLTISPLFVSAVVRAYGWLVVFGPAGPVVNFFASLGLIPERTRVIYTETAVIVGMVEVLLPFLILPISAVLSRIDPNLSHQAQSLGANPLRTFLHVTLPLSLPGLGAGSVLVFISCMGAFVTPSLLGGARIKTLAHEAYATMSTQSDWGLSSTLGLVLLVTTLIGIAIYTRLLAVGTRQSG